MIGFTERRGAFAGVVALTAALLIVPAFGQTTQQNAPMGAPAAPSATQQPSTPAPRPTQHATRSSADIEARIKSLHDRLHVTAAQEQQWEQVAQVMRENAKTMNKMIRERDAKLRTMNAVDNLNAYAGIAEAHADGVKKLASAFDSLYDSMSELQKKDADAVFRGIAAHHRAAPKPAAPTQK
jgi:LTXXQ motif family protein